jgi:hypothetical protein
VLTELDILRDVAGRLDRENIAYMLTGSMAMNYYAQPRMTRDIDIVIEMGPQDAARVIALFERDYYLAEEAVELAVRDQRMFNVLHLNSVIKVDFVVRKSEPFREQEFGRRQRVEIGDAVFWIVSREDLILSKLVWAQESQSELQMRDVRNLLTTDLEWDYMWDWAPALGVERQLEALST